LASRVCIAWYRLASVGADLRLLLQGAHQRPQPLVLIVPPPVQLLEPVQTGRPRVVVAVEPAAVHPGRARFDGHDPGRRPGQQFAVVADEQDGLRAGPQLVLQPAFGRHVEVVVRLVEQQYLVGAAQQRLQGQPLLLTAGQGADHPVLRPLQRDAEGGHRDGVPEHLGVVPAGIAPGGEGFGVAHLGALVVDFHQGDLGGLQPVPGGPHRRGCEGQQQLAHRRRIADRPDELAHHAEPARASDRPGRRSEVAGDQPQQGGVARPVGPHERHLGPVPDPERDVVEQHPAVG